MEHNSNDASTDSGSLETASTISDKSSVSGASDATPRQCEFCDYKSSDTKQFNQHLKTHFEMDDSTSAPAADDQKGRLHVLIEHIKEKKQSKVDTDPDWATVFIGDTTEDGNSIAECFCCDFESTNREELNAHVASHLNDNSTDNVSELTTSEGKNGVRYHTDDVSSLSNSPGKNRVRYCTKCNEEFSSLSLLKAHKRAATCKEKVFACDECNYMTTNGACFRGHKRRNHGEIILKKCHYCDRMFKRTRNLNEHMNTHTGSTPFQCDKCGKAFHTNSSWYKHKRNNCASSTRDRKLCSHCGREVINLSKHISDVHFNIKEFHCQTCGKSFGTQYHLDRHIRIHTGEKPFPCSYCDYRASQKVVTEGHMKKCKFRPQNMEETTDTVND